MRTWRAEIRADMAALNERIGRLEERIGRLEERVSQLGFRAAGILAAGLIALVATQL